ncbi:MAG TPA: hypothetical protein VND92_06300 [Vicinamibacterales bacterium]|nr:hypothetical protein [Vicinamibacterales bacterium]
MKLAFAALLVAGVGYLAQPPAGLDVQTIIQRSVEATKADWKAAPDYDFKERDRGKGGTKTSDVTMIDGSPYYRLLAVNGVPLGPAASQAQQNALDAEVARRRAESPDDRAARIGKYRRELERNHFLTEQMIDAFTFTLGGEQELDSRQVYVLHATPRPGYHPPNLQAEVLPGMRGTLWIDTATFQWVKVKAEVVHPVSIEGFLARVEPGTFFTLEQMPVGDGIWQPKHFSMRSKSLILFLFPHRTQDDETYSDYRRTTPAS